jgi:hypothetical protein
MLFAITMLFQSPSTESFKLKSLKRRYSGNGEWIVTTSKGQYYLKNVFSNGSEWKLKISDKLEYTFKQTFEGDPSEWRITDGKSELFFAVSFSKNFNEWRTGDEGKWVYMKTVYNNDFSEWNADANAGTFAMKRTFSDGSEWTITDDIPQESEMTRLSMMFIPLVVSLHQR